MVAGILLTIGIGLVALASVQLIALGAHATRTGRERMRADMHVREGTARLEAELRRHADALRVDQRAWQGWRTLRVRDVEPEGADCRSFYLESVDGAPLPPFLPGQYLTVGLNDGEGKTTSRCYSLSDAPRSDSFRITVKCVPGGRVSNRLHSEILPGDTLLARAPAGRFVPHPDPDQPLVLIAAGVGITPMVSIVRYCQWCQPQRPIDVFYQVRDLDHAPLLKPLARWAAEHTPGRLALYVSRAGSERPAWVAGFERITPETVLSHCRGRDAAQFMICGPPAMLDEFSAALRAGGVAEENVTVEAFEAIKKQAGSADTPDALADVPAGCEVTFVRSGKSGSCDAERPTLLDMAESLEVPVDSGCRGGECGSCLVRLLRGRVRYAAPPGYGPLADGEALSCVAQPDGPVSVDA